MKSLTKDGIDCVASIAGGGSTSGESRVWSWGAGCG